MAAKVKCDAVDYVLPIIPISVMTDTSIDPLTGPVLASTTAAKGRSIIQLHSLTSADTGNFTL